MTDDPSVITRPDEQRRMSSHSPHPEPDLTEIADPGRSPRFASAFAVGRMLLVVFAVVMAQDSVQSLLAGFVVRTINPWFLTFGLRG